MLDKETEFDREIEEAYAEIAEQTKLLVKLKEDWELSLERGRHD